MVTSLRVIGVVIVVSLLGLAVACENQEPQPQSFIDTDYLVQRAEALQQASRGFARHEPALELADATVSSQKGWDKVVAAVQAEIAERRAARAAAAEAETEVSPSAPTSNSGTSSVGTSREGMWPGATSVWDSQPEWVVEWAKCNVGYESWDSGTYVAENPISTASGVGQWLDGTWASQVANSGIEVNTTAHAASNTPYQQDLVLAWAARFAYGAWTHGCPRM
jgi:hypothetical protein